MDDLDIYRDVRTPSRCELDDMLQQLDIRDDDSCWIEDPADEHSRPHTVCNASSLYYALGEEAGACDVFNYDPLLFTSSSSAPSSEPPSPSGGSFLLHLGDRDKPLPTLPCYSTTPSPPSTPRSSRSLMSTPPSSPRLSLAPSGSQPLPRSRPPSANMGTPRSVYTHAAFPSISSTLSLLEERETEVEKRSGVIVTEAQAKNPVETSRNSSESTILAHQARRANSAEPLATAPNGSSDAIPKRKPRPTLNLSTSTSSPQLRELAELANVPASPILATTYTTSPVTITSPRMIRHQTSLASLSPSVSSPLASSSFLLPPVEVEPPSRWSMDSTSRPEDLGEPPSPPSKSRTRDRLMSLISRARSGSVGKQNRKSPTAPSHEGEFGVSSPNESHFSHGSTNSTNSTSHMRAPYPAPPIATSPSTTSSTSSSSTLPTPADSQSDLTADPFCPASPTFAPSSYLPGVSCSTDELSGRCSPPPAPTLPAPSPSVPTASFFLPSRSQSAFPFLSALAKSRLRRRKKKLVISCLSSYDSFLPQSEGRAQIEAQRQERDMKKRCESVLQWCESFGPVRRVERKPDGSLHVYWKDWEVADMVCRVSGQVFIKGVGRVSLAWRYVN